MTTNHEINQIVKERELNHWHLLITSLLGSLGQKGSNQGALNLLMSRSMDDFILPFLEGLDDARRIKAEVARYADLAQQMSIVIEYINGMFSFAGEIETEQSDDIEKAVVRVRSGSCRYCPIGVGLAKINPDTTFCPLPIMIEKSINYFRGGRAPVKLFLIREKASTHVLVKKDGNCYIAYTTS
jgi:hypothetical protein